MDMTKTLTELGSAVTEMKAAFQTQIDELKAKGSADPLLADKIDRLAKAQAEFDGLKARIEDQDKIDRRLSELEADFDLLAKGRDGRGDKMTPEQKAHLDAFQTFVRNPRDTDAVSKLMAASKTVATTSAASGGYLVPEVLSRMIGEKLQDISPVRRITDVIAVGTPDFKAYVDVAGEAYEWVGEGDTRSQQTEPQLAEVAPTMGTVNAYYWANEEATDDMFIDVAGWLRTAAARAFARAEGSAMVSGNGTNKPTGFLNATPSASGDEASPARAFGTLQYLPTGQAYAAAAPFGVLSVSSPVFYPTDVFVDAMTGLKTGYRAGAVWLMNRMTMGQVMKLRDAEGRPLWQQSLSANVPSQILGSSVVEFPDMPDVGANAFPIAYGDFREGYLMVERHGVRITVDPYTKPGAIKWNIRRRLGGKTKNDDAIKLIKLATS